MTFILLLVWAANGPKQAEVRDTDIAPRIDGVIEDVWLTADSAYDFVQHYPTEKVPASERTVVYLLQDRDNLYVAFRCYAVKHKPVACLTKDEDYVVFGIDPFNSKTNGYYFWVYGSQIKWDGWVLDNGIVRDDSWEGIWDRGVKVYPDRWDIEFKIPFKSIRYKKGLAEWGFQCMRYIATVSETDYWTEVSQQDGDLVSNWGTLKNIEPRATGYFFELYPEAYTRLDRQWRTTAAGYEDTLKFKPFVTMNLKWDITPQTTLNGTVFPDFAQIEADPYTLNLGRYPTLLNERRPFFIEGRDIFSVSNYFQPLNIFYSRRIGKSLNGDVVPIIGGLKLTSKSETWNVGLLGAYTDEYKHKISDLDSIFEPDREFGVLRLKRKVLGNSEVGILASGTMADAGDFNAALEMDGVFRKGPNQFVAQAAVSDNSEKLGWAGAGGFRGFLGKFLTISSVEVVHDSFDVNQIGYVPWAGRRRFSLTSGPFKTYRQGGLANLYIAPTVTIQREPGDSDWSKLGGIMINPGFRNGWGFELDAIVGPKYDADTNYFSREFNLAVWGRMLGQQVNFGGDYFYGFNYNRGYPANQFAGFFVLNYSVIPQMSVGLSGNAWAEWDSAGSLASVMPRIRPNIYFRFNADITLALSTELVYNLPQGEIGERELWTWRKGLLFSWNFRPKSWIYVALNDFQSRDATGALQPQYQVGAVKVKYLFYF